MKNTAALVLGIIGGIFGGIGGLLCATCADACATFADTSTGFMVGFIVLAIVGALLSVLGSVRAYSFKSNRFALLLMGTICQVAMCVMQIVMLEMFVFSISVWFIISIPLCLTATILARKEEA